MSVKDTPATAGESRTGAACIRKVEVSCNADGREYEWKPKYEEIIDMKVISNK